jgi:hypothetical protein
MRSTLESGVRAHRRTLHAGVPAVRSHGPTRHAAELGWRTHCSMGPAAKVGARATDRCATSRVMHRRTTSDRRMRPSCSFGSGLRATTRWRTHRWPSGAVHSRMQSSHAGGELFGTQLPILVAVQTQEDRFGVHVGTIGRAGFGSCIGTRRTAVSAGWTGATTRWRTGFGSRGTALSTGWARSAT